MSPHDRWLSPKAMQLRVVVLLTLACAEEFRGSSYNAATFKQAKQSSTAYIEGAITTADRAVDGDGSGHLWFSEGCAVTDWQANPWWRVDLGNLIPLAVVRIYPRTDNRQFTMTGLQIRVGLKDNWDEISACASDIILQTVGVTAVNCFASGRFLYTGAPNTESARLAICEIDIVVRGPKEVKEYTGAIGRPLNLRIEGVGMLPEDRLRIVHPSILCGSPGANTMHEDLVERNRPYGPPEVESNIAESWMGIEFLKMGFYKLCWCSGMLSCTSGTDFAFLVGFAIIAGEMRTVAGNGTDPVSNSDEWEDLYSARVGAVSGMALSDDGQKLYYSEPHRVREALFSNGSVRTLVGDLVAGNCVPPLNQGDICGDGLPGTSARLHDPRGLSVCRGELLIADYLNSRIRAYDFATGIVSTKVGTTHGYDGDGGAPDMAQLSGPLGVACDTLRGYWISDTGSNAIRGVRVSPGQSDVITTVIGGRGEGLASPGTWSSQAQLHGPAQLVMSQSSGAPRSLVYVESTNAVARFLPMGSRVMEGAVQAVIGTGETGYMSVNLGSNIRMDSPEGVAVHSSTVFIADTKNHRILMVPILEYAPLGCYKEVTIEGESTLIPSLEGDAEAGLVPPQVCGDEVLNVQDAVARCARATMRKGWDVFAVRCGGVCASALDADQWYRWNGAGVCEKGRGGLTANSVYRIIKEHAKDMLGKYYIIAGQALTNQAINPEKPRPGYFGDRLASWYSDMDEPSQMAASETTRNLFFGDRGNKRVRVIFGSLGPQPRTQQFYCTNGLECVLSVHGNGFSEKDHIAFSRDYLTGTPVVCGQDRLENQFPQVYNLAEWSRLFLSKNFNLGPILLPVVGQFIVCYCIGNAGKDCDVTTDYEFKAGRLHVVGPNARSTVYALAGVRFDLALFGAAFRLTDRIRFIRRNETCGAGGETPVDEMLPFVRASGNASLKAGLGPWDEGSETYQVWRDLVVEQAAELKVCWCDVAPCPFDSYFQVEAMYLSVGGPEPKTQSVEFGQPFDLLLEGPGGFKAADRVRLQDASVPCNTPQRRADLEDALPLDATPCEISATSVRWCGVKIPLSAPSSLVACWCGSLGGFDSTNYTGVPAVWLTVGPGPQVQGAPGPTYRRDLPPPPLSEEWPNYINKGSYNVSVRLYGRNALGSGSPGPLHVAICEMTTRCLEPLELRELSNGGFATAEALRTWNGTTLFPRAVKVTSLSMDPYLADFVDVELLQRWRRFPLNQWLVMQDGDGRNTWESFTAPPKPTAAPAETAYTEGDPCGGCGLGSICRERPQTALELAQQGISLSTASTVYMTWDCQFACGDGLVIGEEQCDDGNLEAFDGCDSSCQVEPGFVCDGATGTAPSQCRPVGCGPEPHPRPVAPCQDDAVSVCRRNSELSGCGSLSPPSIFAGCSGQANQRCEAAVARPKAVLAQFVGSSVVVTFDSAMAELNGTSYGTEFPCSEFFAPATVAELGDGATCLQDSPRHVTARLGFGAALGVEDSTAVHVLDEARQYQQIDAPIQVTRLFEFPSQRVFLGPALGESNNFQLPQVLLRGPNVWGECGDLTLDGSFSLGSGGRPWKFIRWGCTGVTTHCIQILSYLPNTCNQLSPSEAAGLSRAVPCGLRATIPESVAAELVAKLASVVIWLKLENVFGQWDEAFHSVRFTNERVPMAVALSNSAIFVDQGSSIRLELSVGPALPVASLGAGTTCGALGPVSLEWRYSSESFMDPSQAWASLSSTPPSLIASLDAKTAILEGFLGELDVPGTNWTLVARVFHAAESADVFVPFLLVVRPQPPSIHLEAPTQISDSCSFSVVATTGGVSGGDPYVTWKCVLMDIVPFVADQDQDASECSSRALLSRGPVLSLPALIPGVYQIEATLDDPLKPMDVVFVHVAAGFGPRVQILEPAEPLERSGDGDEVRFRARLEATSCGKGAMTAAVVVLSSLPGEVLGTSRPETILAAKVVTASSDVQPDDNFEAVIPLSTLEIGLSHRFQLLLAEGVAREALEQYISGVSTMPNSLLVPAEVWAYESAPVTRTMPPALRLFVDPATGFASRTLFTLRARALCEGCTYAFRFASRSLNVNSTDCSSASGSWEELRPWSSDPEAILPLLGGQYVLEARVMSTTGGTSQACHMVDVMDSNLDPTFAGLTPQEAEEAIKTWTSDASRSIATLRALQQPSLLVQSLESIAQEFPQSKNLDVGTQENSGDAMRQLYTEICEGATDALKGLPASEFQPSTSRRLSSGAPLLTSTLQSLLECMDGLFPLLTLTEVWQTLQILDVTLERNAVLRGTLGPGSPGTPLASYPMLGLADLGLVRAYYIANSTSSAITRSNTTALVDRLMIAAVDIGDAAASSIATFAEQKPIEVLNEGRGLLLSTKIVSGSIVTSSGIEMERPTDVFQEVPYGGLRVPPIPTGLYNELQENVTTTGGPAACLGDATLMNKLDLVLVQWGFNVIAVGGRLGSAAPAGGVLISVHDLRLRSCGLDVPLAAALGGQEVDIFLELPLEVVQERRWGYGDVSPFRCVRWVSSGIGRPGQWLADGCASVYRAQEEAAVGDKAGLPEGILRCRCNGLIPGTWAIEIVPRPALVVEVPELLNVSVRTLVAYGVLLLWMPFLLPLLIWAFLGDLILNLSGEEATRKLSESLLPAAATYGGVWAEAEKYLQKRPWPLRSSFSLHFVASLIVLRSCRRRKHWQDEAKELSRYRDALCFARLRGGRVHAEPEVKALEGPAPPAEDPTIRDRAPAARWRKGPAALPAATSADSRAAVKAQPEETPKLLSNQSNQPDPIGSLLKQPDAYEEHTAKQAALNMTEYDWSEQVRGQVTTTGVQRNVLPEGWISQSAGGQQYYVNLLDGKSCWERPTQPAVKVLSMQELRGLLGPAADGVSLRRQLEEMLRPRIAERLAAMDVATAGQERRVQAEARHQAPPQENDLRQVAAEPTSDLQPAMEGSLRLPLRFRALAWGFCTLFGACLLRTWPPTAALIPCLRPSRLERAAKCAYRLNAGLAFAAGVAGLKAVADEAGVNEAVDAARPDAELWAEMQVMHPVTIAIGLVSVVAARFLAALLPSFAAMQETEMDKFSGRSTWWKNACMKQRQTELLTVFLSVGAALLAMLLAAWKPQPRASLAFAAFCWVALSELLLLPFLSALLQTFAIYCVSRDCCCGQATYLARFPGLLDFPHQGSWTSRELLLKHLEALCDSSPRHQVKR